MQCGYFDCFSGAAGDMILAAMIDAGCPVETLQDTIAALPLPEVKLTTQRVKRGGLAATYVHVDVDRAADIPHRHLPQILDILAGAALSSETTERASRVFRRLAEAEAAAHGIDIDQVHFHEVGAADAIVDIVGVCVGVELLGLERLVCAPIPTGHGTVTCAHGVLPIPAPATANLLIGVPLAECDEPAELTTPTGAALLTTLSDSYGPLPPMRLSKIGYGAGTREGTTRPNLLRLLIGELESDNTDERDRVVVIETQLDDASGQNVSHACQELLAAGALDVFIVPIIMKKGRPGQLLTVIAQPEDVSRLEDIVFRETTTFGIRRHECLRDKLARTHASVSTRYGVIRIKVGRRDNRVWQTWPEYEDCVMAARQGQVPLRTVQQEALRLWMESDDSK
ncbi:MAG: nickel pincer cofactor biosynthesis protein LarC [Planctomycetota bacterium]